MGVSTLLLLPWSFIRLSPATVGLLCSEGPAQWGGWGRGLGFGCAVWARRLWRLWLLGRTLGAVRDFGSVGVFSFTAAAVGAAAAAIIGTSTGLDTAGVPALFPLSFSPRRPVSRWRFS